MQDKDDGVRRRAADAVGECYSHIPGESRKQAWDDLHRLTQDKDDDVRYRAADAIGECYSHIPEESRKQAWNDLHRLMQDKDHSVRVGAVSSLSTCYSHLFDEFKRQAWDDLIILTQGHYDDTELDFICISAVHILGTCYHHIPEDFKKKAWDDLHMLTQDKDDGVRKGAARAVGECYSRIPEESRKQAWDDLHRVRQDKNIDIRIIANHSSGRVSIIRASEAENKDGFRKEIENALEFFEKASKEWTYDNPAKFCLPFYRSFYTLIFKKEDNEAEVQRYLSEAKSAMAGSERFFRRIYRGKASMVKSAMKGSESKEKLFEAVKNLGNALKEAQKARDFNDLKSDLNAYRRYCERACELLDTTEEEAPGASKLIRKGLPIIDERIKGIIGEIQEKAKALCKQVKDTEYKEIGQQVNNVGQELSKVIDPIRLEKEVSHMLIPLSAMCKKMPEEDRGEACELLKQINEEQNVEDKLPLISMFLSKISTQMNKDQIMANIHIENSEGAQVIVGTGNKQVHGPNFSLK